MSNAGHPHIYDASRDLVEAVRELMLATTLCDVDVAQMNEAKDLVTRAAELLGERVRTTGRREHLDRDAIARIQHGEAWTVFTHNPMGIPLAITVSGAEAGATITPTALFEGPPNILHGGFVAAMLDALLSTLVQAQDIRAVTVQLDVRFRRAATIGTALILGATIDSIEGRKIKASGWIHSAGETIADADALFITIPGEPD
jgi:acyl-coenzyme A thioesterase PaaI-like protein